MMSSSSTDSAGSGSVQSHLSALNSKSRHRDHLARSLTFVGEPSNTNALPVLVLAPSNLELSDGVLLRPRAWLNSHRWMLSVYVILSLVFFSASLSRGYYAFRLDNRPSPTLLSQTRSSSALNALSSAARLEKIVALHPPPTHFNPFTYFPVIDPHSHEITACLWAPEHKLDWLSTWTTEWPGLISLVVVARNSPLSTRAPPRPGLARLLHHPMLNASRLTLHMLHLDPATPDAPNVFLNLARLFAPTRAVLLVPGTPPHPPSSSAISSFSIAQMRDPVIVRAGAAEPRKGVAADKRRPTGLPALIPVLIPRDHPLWCTERFAFVPAPVAERSADWDACLWQVQLETFGTATTGGPTLPGWQWDVEPDPLPLALPSASVTAGIRRRLDVRYRAETCVLAIKRLEILGEEWHGGGGGRLGARLGRKNAERIRLLHEMCRET